MPKVALIVQFGRLPGPLAAMNQSNITVQQLGVGKLTQNK
jgi:hypothetical protein